MTKTTAVLIVIAIVLGAVVAPGTTSAEEPRLDFLQPGVRLTKLVENPEVVTPTGIGVMPSGDIVVAASHTHFRPKEYDGPANDEVLIFDAKGKNRRVLYNATSATMEMS